MHSVTAVTSICIRCWGLVTIVIVRLWSKKKRARYYQNQFWVWWVKAVVERPSFLSVPSALELVVLPPWDASLGLCTASWTLRGYQLPQALTFPLMEIKKKIPTKFPLGSLPGLAFCPSRKFSLTEYLEIKVKMMLHLKGTSQITARNNRICVLLPSLAS